MKKAKATFQELLDRLVPVAGLDGATLARYQALLARSDGPGIEHETRDFLERLCDLGLMRRLESAAVNGGTRLRYRNLTSLDSIAFVVPSLADGTPAGPPDDDRAVARAADAPAAVGADIPATFLEALAASSRRVDLSGSLGHLYELLQESVGYDRVALFISRDLLDSAVVPLTELEDVCRWPDEERFCPEHVAARVESAGETIFVPDVTADPRFARCSLGRAFRSVAVAPLVTEAYVYGVLEVWNARPNAYQARDLAMIRFAAEFAAGLIRRRLEVEELVFVDQTSQIHNRRYFDEQLEREIERANRTSRPLALLMVDLDHFKLVNDTLGHAAGDSILRQVAAALSENARQVDIVARYGGEEFALLLPDVTPESARAVAERLRETVAAGQFITGLDERPTWQITLSIGGALYPLDAETKDSLLDRADRVALYAAKREGRDRVVFWRDTQDR